MKGDDIPENDTISRYCPYKKLSEETGKPLGAVFQLRDRDHQSENPHISVNWLEYFDDKDREGQIKEVRTILSKKMKSISRKAKLALLNVKKIYEQFESSDYNIRVLHWPDHTDDYDDPSHAGIFDVESDPDVIADMIAQVECELVPAKVE